MKKADSVQLIILVLALLMGYNALQTLPYFLWVFYNWFSEGLTLGDRFHNLAINFLYLIFYVITTVILIRKSKSIAEKVESTASFSSTTDIFLKRNDILYVTFIGLGSYTLMTKLPKLLVKFYTYVRESNKPLIDNGPNYTLPGESFPEYIMIIIFAVVMVVYAKTLTEFITRHLQDDTDIDTIGTTVEEN